MKEKPVCPFHDKEGSRCVLDAHIRDYSKCGPVACTIESNNSVSRPE